MPAGVRAPSGAAACGAIGPIGAGARILVGTVLLALAAFWREPQWSDAALGLTPSPRLDHDGPASAGPSASYAVARHRPAGPCPQPRAAAALFALPATAGPTVSFYGVLAAVRRAGGCELTAISNLLLRRDDQIGCALFGPIDLSEANATNPRRAR